MHLVFALPDPTETGGGGGSDYIDGLAPALRDLGHRVEIVCGLNPVIPPGATPVIDGMLLPRLQSRLEELVASDAVVLLHHVAAAAGRDEGAREAILEVERTMLPRLRRVVATSQPVADRLSSAFGIAAHPIPPGARDRPRTIPDRETDRILAVGVLTRRKRHDQLLQVVARLTDLPWRLVIAGDANREPEHAAELRAMVERLSLADRVEIAANPTTEALERLWANPSIFALATRWEGYATGAAEALRRGIPAVVTDTGGAGTFIPIDAGAVCPVDDMATFGKCLRRLLFDRDLRAAIADAAWRAGQDLPGWPIRAQEFAAIVES